MNALRKYKKDPIILLTTGFILVIASLLWNAFPIFIFIALAPLFALLDFPWKPKNVSRILVLSIVGVVGMSLMSNLGVIVMIIFYGLLSIALFAAYSSMQYLTHNRLNKFALVILFMGAEYLLLKFMIHKNPVFLADIFQQKNTWIRWNMFTGYLGISLWIMLANLIVYQALLKPEGINPFLLVLGIVIVVMPILYSFSLTNNAVTKPEVLRFYSGNSTDLNDTYALHGELISRTGAWVSILIIIFTLVRAKTGKVAR